MLLKGSCAASAIRSSVFSACSFSKNKGTFRFDAFDDERKDEGSLVWAESSVQAGHEHGEVLWRNSAIERW